MAPPWLVMKFGGTSVGTGERLAAVADIAIAQLAHARPVLVCSAMSSHKKASGTTSLLLRAAEDAMHAPSIAAALDGVDRIQSLHTEAAALALRDSDESLRSRTLDAIRAECERLKDFLRAIRIIDEVSPRSKDLIVSTGEKLSCTVVAAVLQSKGYPAVAINLERVIDREFDPSHLDQSFYDYVSERIRETIAETLTKTPDAIPILTGFFGTVPGSLLAAVGRGYTDLCAALCAVGLNAAELQIWKEVDGIFTTDPRTVPTARRLDTITPDEANELTFYGSEVIHPFTMDQAIRAGIQLRIKNTFNPTGPGTIIAPAPATPEAESFDLSDPRRILPHDPINIRSNRKSNSHGFLSSIFAVLDRHGVAVDMITTSEVHVSMALHVEDHDVEVNDRGEPRVLAKVIAEFRKLGMVSLLPRQVILSVVGRYMRNMVGTAGRMFSILAGVKCNIEMISQGASEINISCVISQDSADLALRAVHDQLILGLAPSANGHAAST